MRIFDALQMPFCSFWPVPRPSKSPPALQKWCSRCGKTQLLEKSCFLLKKSTLTKNTKTTPQKVYQKSPKMTLPPDSKMGPWRHLSLKKTISLSVSVLDLICETPGSDLGHFWQRFRDRYSQKSTLANLRIFPRRAQLASCYCIRQSFPDLYIWHLPRSILLLTEAWLYRQLRPELPSDKDGGRRCHAAGDFN